MNNRKVSMEDVARLAGVSRATVSRALARDPRISTVTRERVLQVAREQGYVLNEAGRRFRTGRTDTIAVVVPMAHAEQQSLADPFFSTMLGLLADELARRGHDMLFHRSASLALDGLQKLAAPHRTDGIIVIGQSFAQDCLVQAAHRGMPLVVWGEMSAAEEGYAGVGSDNVGGGRLATEHLLSRGRRRILFVGDTRLPEVNARFRGCMAALQDSGIRPDAELVLNSSFDALDLGQQLRARLAAGLTFDAVFASSDVLAIEAIGVLLQLGHRVPEDIAVIGFDDMPLASCVHPPLTSIRQNLPAAAQQLVELLLGEPVASALSRIVLPVELVLRQSA